MKTPSPWTLALLTWALAHFGGCAPDGPALTATSRPGNLSAVTANDQGVLVGLYADTPGDSTRGLAVVGADGALVKIPDVPGSHLMSGSEAAGWALPNGEVLASAVFGSALEPGIARIKGTTVTREQLPAATPPGVRLAVSRDGVAIAAYTAEVRDGAGQLTGKTTLGLLRNQGAGWEAWVKAELDVDSASINGLSAASKDHVWLLLVASGPRITTPLSLVHVGDGGPSDFYAIPDCTDVATPALGCDRPTLLALGEFAFTWTARGPRATHFEVGGNAHSFGPLDGKDVVAIAGTALEDLWVLVRVETSRQECGTSSLNPYTGGGNVRTCSNALELRLAHYDGENVLWFHPPDQLFGWLVATGVGRARIEGKYFDQYAGEWVWADAP